MMSMVGCSKDPKTSKPLQRKMHTQNHVFPGGTLLRWGKSPVSVHVCSLLGHTANHDRTMVGNE